MHAKIRLLLKKIIYFAYYFALIKGLKAGKNNKSVRSKQIRKWHKKMFLKKWYHFSVKSMVLYFRQ